MAFTLMINGTPHEMDVDGDTPLLWVLRFVGAAGDDTRSLGIAKAFHKSKTQWHREAAGGYGDSLYYSIPNLPNTVTHPSLSGGRRARSAAHHPRRLSALTYFSPWAAATGSQVTLPSWTLSPARRCGSS